jgi:hypothetical protein
LGLTLSMLFSVLVRLAPPFSGLRAASSKLTPTRSRLRGKRSVSKPDGDAPKKPREPERN